ncbi:DNA-binding transcriptional regulator, FadR family [Sphingobium faniae]|nr:DNA-binding transcriptional regulator, FadR family [Sphingobium faniae]
MHDFADGQLLSDRKLSEQMAVRLIGQIASRGLGPDAFLGNEEALAKEFQASRSVIRETVAMLEGCGLVEARRGKAGGLFVTRPDALSVARYMTPYLRYRTVKPTSAIRLLTILDRLLLQSLSRVELDPKLFAGAVSKLKSGQHLAGSLEAYGAFCKVIANPVIEALITVCVQIVAGAALRSHLSDEAVAGIIADISYLRIGQIDSMINGRLQEALETEEQILNRSLRLLASAATSREPAQPKSRALKLFGNVRQLKRSELLGEQIISDIIALGWREGQHLGNEKELLARYSVSRLVFRQAVRSLEEMGYVSMRSGADSGLKVGAPEERKIVSRVRWQFSLMNLEDRHYHVVFNGIATDFLRRVSPQALSHFPLEHDLVSAIHIFAQREADPALSLALAIVSPVAVAESTNPASEGGAHDVGG